MATTRILSDIDQLIRRGRLRDAERILERHIKSSPDDPTVLNHLGLLKAQLGDLAGAVAIWRRAHSLNPSDGNTLTNLGTALRLLGFAEEALAPLSQAAALQPSAITFNNLGLAKMDLYCFTEAMQAFLAAIDHDKNYPEAHNNLGTVLIKMHRIQEALPALSTAISLRPHYPKALTNRAAAFLELGRADESLNDLQQSLALDPNQDFLPGLLLHTSMQQCRWDGLPELLPRIEHGLRDGKRVAAGFALVGAVEDPILLRAAGEIWCRSQIPQLTIKKNPPSTRTQKIKIGYFSADFHNHATAHLIAGLIESHDRSRFDVSAYSFGPIRCDETRTRLSNAFDHFIEVGTLSDQQIATLAKSHEIDVAIDLKGYTQGSRPGIFANRAAPVQVNYLGYPGTMAAPFMDYIVADPFLIPEGTEGHFSEQVIRLPNSYQANDNRRPRPAVRPTRAELGLADDAFVFCNFNNSYKITPEVFETWATILRAEDSSVLWLLQDNATAADNLRRAAQTAGVEPNRLVFAPRASVEEHLARHSAADLFLDTWPCNAHTTASDALWMGLPLITLSQRSFASRVAGSLLSAVGLPELICRDRTHYIRIALELARDRARLTALRSHLESHPQQLRLFDTTRFCRNFEAALTYATELSRKQHPAKAFSVDSHGSIC